MTASANPQDAWATPAKIAAWLAGLVGVFLIKPPDLQYYGEGSSIWLHLCQFVLAVLIGLFFLNPKTDPSSAKRWRNLAIAALLGGVVLFVVYQALRPEWSCVYRGVRVVAGGTLLENAANYLRSNPSATCDRLIAAAMGYTEKVWPIRDLITRYLILCALYSVALLAFSAAAMSMIEHVRAGRASPEG